MATIDLGVPDEIQSGMHDLADDIGERIAKGEILNYVLTTTAPDSPPKAEVCTCLRYSERDPSDNEYVKFWFESDPNCRYIHPTALPRPHRIKIVQ